MSQQKPEQPPAPVVLTTNAIIGGKFYAAGDALPFAAPGDLPEPLKPFIAAGETDEPPGPPTLNFQPNRVYAVNPEGAIITRAGAREAARLAGEAYAQQQAEEEAIAAGELPPETIAALQDEHDKHIGLQIKAAEVAQARIDAAYAAAQEAAEREAEPAKPSEFFVKRGAVFMHAEKAKLRPGEQVFTRQPNGQQWLAGLVDASGGLPPPEVTI